VENIHLIEYPTANYTTHNSKGKYTSLQAQQTRGSQHLLTKPQTPYKNREKEKEKKTNPMNEVLACT
jgi:hypothetical protein